MTGREPSAGPAFKGVIRAATEAECSALVQLDTRCFARPWTASAWEAEFGRAFARIWVWTPGADQQDSVGGYCVCWHLGQEAELLRIAVAPSLRGQGVGASLLDWALAKARQEGCLSLSLEVQADNRAAVCMYEKSGFERVGARAGYYQGKDALLMKVGLTSL